MNDPQKNIDHLNLYLRLDEYAAQAIESIENKIEGATTDTVECRIATLETIKMVLGIQRTELARFVEQTAATNDKLQEILDALPKK